MPILLALLGVGLVGGIALAVMAKAVTVVTLAGGNMGTIASGGKPVQLNLPAGATWIAATSGAGVAAVPSGSTPWTVDPNAGPLTITFNQGGTPVVTNITIQ